MAKLDTKSTQPLKVNIKQLGAQLGKVMAECDSADLLNEVEFVRLRAKDLRKGNRTKNDGRSSRRTLQERDDLHHFFAQLGDEESFKIAKAFTEFLRLANAAEQYHRVRRRRFYETHSRCPQKGSVEGF